MDSKKTDDPEKATACAKAKAVLTSLKTADQRVQFLDTFNKDTGKTMAWVNEFEEVCQNTEVHEEKGVRGYCNVSQALDLKKLKIGI